MYVLCSLCIHLINKVLEVNPFTPANDVTEHNKYSFRAHTYLPFCIDLDHCMTMLGCPHKIA